MRNFEIEFVDDEGLIEEFINLIRSPKDLLIGFLLTGCIFVFYLGIILLSDIIK